MDMAHHAGGGDGGGDSDSEYQWESDESYDERKGRRKSGGRRRSNANKRRSRGRGSGAGDGGGGEEGGDGAGGLADGLEALNQVLAGRGVKHLGGIGALQWSDAEDEALNEAVERLGTSDWKAIADAMKAQGHSRSAQQCMARFCRALGRAPAKVSWTKEQDDLIRAEVAARGGAEHVKWAELASLIGGRIGKQCRERWHFALDPAIRRGPFTPAEDMALWDARMRVGEGMRAWQQCSSSSALQLQESFSRRVAALPCAPRSIHLGASRFLNTPHTSHLTSPLPCPLQATGGLRSPAPCLGATTT